MFQTVTVEIPSRCAAKLYELRLNPADRHLTTEIEKWLATMGRTGSRFAASPPLAMTVPSGGDLISQIADVRSVIGRLNASIQAILGLADDVSALIDLDDDPSFDAILLERLRLERAEEALVQAAIAAGYSVSRRPDADPRAVLEIVDLDDLPVVGAA